MDNSASLTSSERLSAAVGRLAKDAHRLLRAEDVDPKLLARVRSRIDSLEKRIAGLPDAPIHRWLENLRRPISLLTRHFV